MGAAILRSQDCLQSRFLHDAFSLTSSCVRSRRNSSPNSNCAYYTRRRKRSPVAIHANNHGWDRKSSGDRSTVVKSPAANPVMGQVKILKRGERLSTESRVVIPTENRKATGMNEENFDFLLGSTNRFGPDPMTVQKQVTFSGSKDGIYAGSAFASSPPPSSVPVPAFLAKNGTATSDLRRLLRLDLE